jgi:hypothetical protein
VGEGWINGESERGQILSMCFVYMNENTIMRPVEIVLRRGRGMRENDGRGGFN